jgi:hypothetical protein
MITLAFPVCGKSCWSFLVGIPFLLVALLSTRVAMAQTQQQPFLFASTSVNGQEAVVTFLRDETTGSSKSWQLNALSLTLVVN